MLFTYGINHKSAPLDIREQVVFSSDHMPQILHDLLHREAVNEVVLLSTCHRTEIYTTTNHAITVEKWLAKRAHSNNIHAHCYRYEDEDMIRHLMRVASGLDSMVLGEPQILGQMKQAYAMASDVGTVGVRLKNLFPAIFAATKQVRHQTAIGENPVSVAYAVVQLAKRIFSKISECKILFIGAGETIKLVATYLYSQGATQLFVANRTLERARTLSDPLQAHPIRIGEIHAYLKEVDMIVTATASQLPILGKGALESALHSRKRRPIFIADLAVPRDVEPEVGQLEDIYLYHLDDLHTLIAQNLQDRADAAKQAEAMIAMQTEHYMRQLRVMNSADTIRNFRERLEKLRDQELTKALDSLARSENPPAVLASLAHHLTNKIMHQPTMKLRQAAAAEQWDVLLLVKELFNL